MIPGAAQLDRLHVAGSNKTNIFAWLHTFWVNLQAGQLPELGPFSYVILAVLVLIEGPIATLIGSAAASAGFLRPYLVFISAAAGNLIADSLWYTLGYAGREEWFIRLGRRFGVKPRYVERLKQGMHDHATKILLVAKLTSGFIIPALIAAGLMRVPWRRWFPVILLGEMFWTGTLVLVGYYATEMIKKVERGIEYLGIGASFLLILALLYYIRNRLRKRTPLIQNGNGNGVGENG